jgi:NAD(P)-dependent dehydrogenase (short-subunit alcohol dehydrogenase family)
VISARRSEAVLITGCSTGIGRATAEYLAGKGHTVYGGVLVNNAGYSQSGAVESIPMDAVRRQFETNVFGLVRMCQLVLPGMRGQRWGRIINISSMGGRLAGAGH